METETPTKTITTMSYAVGDDALGMICRGGTSLEPCTVTSVGHHENQVHDLIPDVTVEFRDGETRRYSGGGIRDYLLKVVPA